MKLTQHFTLEEATVSSTAKQRGLDNSPNSTELWELKFTAGCMEEVRRLLGNKPIKVNSWFRSAAVNAAVGGVSNSQHRKGQAVDFTCAQFGTPLEICRFLSKHKEALGYDQLILEPTWVHISFVRSCPRRSDLTLAPGGRYLSGIVEL